MGDYICIFNVEYFYYLVCQIAGLKAALARKDRELEHFKQYANRITEMPRFKSNPQLFVPTSWTSGGRKLPRDDSSSMEVTYY